MRKETRNIAYLVKGFSKLIIMAMAIAQVIPLPVISPVAQAVTSVSVNAYTTSGDGSIRYWNSSKFLVARKALKGQNGPGRTGVNTGILAEGATGWNDGTNWVIARTFLPFDTSAVPTNAIIDSATLYIKGSIYVKGGLVSLVKSKQASSTILTDQDYGSIVFTKQAADINSSVFGTSPSMKTWALNSTGISGITKGGVSKFAVISANDFNNTEPPTGGTNNFGLTDISTSRAPLADRPYLKISYHLPTPAPAPAPKPVVTPTPTTTPVTKVLVKAYTMSGDGSIRYWDNTKFVTARSATAGQNGPGRTGVNTGILAEGATGWNDGTNWVIARTFLPFDTSAVPANAVIDSAILHIKGGKYVMGDFVSLVASKQANPNTLTDQDYGSIVFTKQAADINTSVFGTTASIQSWPLNTTGISSIIKGGVSKFAVISANDFNNTEPTTGGAYNFGLTDISTSRAPLTDRPYLEISYQIPATGTKPTPTPTTTPVVTPTPAPVVVPTPAPLPPQPPIVIPRPVLQFQNPQGSALYNQPYQNLSFSIPVNGQYFYNLGDNRNSAMFVRKGMTIYFSDFQSLGQTKMLQMIQDIGLSPTASYPWYTAGALSEIATKVQNAGLPLNINASQGTFVIAPSDGMYLVTLGRKVFQEKTGINPESITNRYNGADFATAGFTNVAGDISIFIPELATKNSLSIINDYPNGSYFLVNNEKGTAQQITTEAANALIASGLQINFLSVNFDSAFAQQLGLQLLPGFDYNAQRFVTYGDASEVITRTISPVNPYASDLISSLTGSISKAPSLAQNLAAAGATPAQIAALVAAAPTASQAAQAILDASKGGGQAALQNANYIITPAQLATITGVQYVNPASLPSPTPVATSTGSVLNRPEAGDLLYLEMEKGFVCYITTCKIASTNVTGIGEIPLPIVPEYFLEWKKPFVNLGANIFSTYVNLIPQISEATRLNILKQVSAQPVLFYNNSLVLPTDKFIDQWNPDMKRDFENISIGGNDYCLIASGVMAGYPMIKSPNGNPKFRESIEMIKSVNGVLVASADALRGIQEINTSLAAGLPIIVGVNRSVNGIEGSSTDHYVVIVGSSFGTDGSQYYRFFDAGTVQKTSDGTGMLGASDQAKLRFYPVSSMLSGNRMYNADSGVIYTVTSVLPRP